MDKKELAKRAIEEGEGIFRLAPVWVSRSFCRPGKRIKLHPDELSCIRTIIMRWEQIGEELMNVGFPQRHGRRMVRKRLQMRE